MTSEERKEARYQRRKAKRLANRQKRSDAVGSLEDVYRPHVVFSYGQKCCSNVRWKQSVQNFELHLFSGSAARRRAVLDKDWKPKKCVRFPLRERGKVRIIDAPHIEDRQIQKVETNKILIPLYTPSMIYDNGASQKRKGTHWHYKRIVQQLSWHYRRYGREGGVFLLDLKGFFPNANRSIIYSHHNQVMLTPGIREFADYIVDKVPSGNAPGLGMPLGIEPSQQEMVSMPNQIDNYIKCQLGIHCAGHYMDDYYIFYHDMEKLKEIAADIIDRFEKLGIPVNHKKCKIVPLTKPFRICKVRFTLTETGKVKLNGNRDSMKRARRKLKFFHKQYIAGKMSMFEINQYMACQKAYYSNFDDHGRLLRLQRLDYALFHEYREAEKLRDKNGTIQYAGQNT